MTALEYFKEQDAEAWRITGSIESMEDYLHDWEQYETETDIAAYDADKRQQLRDERPRSYEIDEISK